MNNHDDGLYNEISTSDLTKMDIERVKQKNFKLLQDDDYGIIPKLKHSGRLLFLKADLDEFIQKPCVDYSSNNTSKSKLLPTTRTNTLYQSRVL